MRLETFFEKFELFAGAPNAVERMRELVLELAVEGKLVSQSSKEEPACKLLVKILKDRADQLKAGTSRRTKNIPEVPPPHKIPDKWIWTQLGYVADWGSGSTPARGNHDYYEGDITWLKSGELNDNRELKDSSEKVTQIALKKGSFRLNQSGDILFAMYGATVGKVAILAEEAVTNQSSLINSPSSLV